MIGSATMLAGCQQKMADQPALRPYSKSSLFKHGQSARPLEQGVFHTKQYLDSDPMVTWLTPEGRKLRANVDPSGEAAYDKDSVVPPVGVPDNPDHFVKELPFQPTAEELKRGQVLYNANCALCHGAAGYGDGKIPERGYLRPPSYHTDPSGKEMDWSTLGEYSTHLPAGYSRGFYRWGIKIPLKDVPIGYFVQVITWGYGGMATHDTQLPDPKDRWLVAAYVRLLQKSQSVPVDELPENIRQEISQKANGEVSK